MMNEESEDKQERKDAIYEREGIRNRGRTNNYYYYTLVPSKLSYMNPHFSV